MPNLLWMVTLWLVSIWVGSRTRAGWTEGSIWGSSRVLGREVNDTSELWGLCCSPQGASEMSLNHFNQRQYNFGVRGPDVFFFFTFPSLSPSNGYLKTYSVWGSVLAIGKCRTRQARFLLPWCFHPGDGDTVNEPNKWARWFLVLWKLNRVSVTVWLGKKGLYYIGSLRMTTWRKWFWGKIWILK